MNRDNLYIGKIINIISNNNLIILVFFIGFFLRLTLFLLVQPWDDKILNEIILVGDAKGYHSLAQSILQSGVFNSTFRTPGYPFFITTIYYLFGTNPWIVIISQILIDSGTILLVYFFAKFIFDERSAIVASVLYAVDPIAILCSNKLLCESLFTFFFISSVYFLIVFLVNEMLISVSLCGIFLGIATLIKPIALYFPLVSFVIILAYKKLSWFSRFKAGLIFLLFFIIAISGWMYRNQDKYNVLSISSIQGYNLLFYNVAKTEATRTKTNFEDIQRKLREKAISRGTNKNIDAFEREKIYKEMAFQYIKNNFLRYAIAHIKGSLNMLKGIGLGHYYKMLGIEMSGARFSDFKSESLLKWFVNVIFNVPLHEIMLKISDYFHLFFYFNLMLFVFGSISLIRKNCGYFLFIISIVMLYFILITGPVGYSRYRMPIIPLYVIIIGIGLIYLYNLIKGRFCQISDGPTLS